MTSFASYPGDNPDNDQELQHGDQVYLQRNGVKENDPYTVIKAGTHIHDYDYIVESVAGQRIEVNVSEVLDQDGIVILVLASDKDTTELPVLIKPEEEYELLGTEASRPVSLS